MTIRMQPPRNKSSHIKSIGHDAETGTLAVEFHKGGVYHYNGVSRETFSDLHGCDSCGGFFRKNIVGKFKGAKR